MFAPVSTAEADTSDKNIPAAAEAVPYALDTSTVLCHCVYLLLDEFDGVGVGLTVTMAIREGFDLTKRAFFAFHGL